MEFGDQVGQQILYARRTGSVHHRLSLATTFQRHVVEQKANPLLQPFPDSFPDFTYQLGLLDSAPATLPFFGDIIIHQAHLIHIRACRRFLVSAEPQPWPSQIADLHVTFLNQNSASPAHTQAAGLPFYTTCYHHKPSAWILGEQGLNHSRYLISVDKINESEKARDIIREKIFKSNCFGRENKSSHLRTKTMAACSHAAGLA